jgi:hypothetical protein
MKKLLSIFLFSAASLDASYVYAGVQGKLKPQMIGVVAHWSYTTHYPTQGWANISAPVDLVRFCFPELGKDADTYGLVELEDSADMILFVIDSETQKVLHAVLLSIEQRNDKRYVKPVIYDNPQELFEQVYNVLWFGGAVGSYASALHDSAHAELCVPTCGQDGREYERIKKFAEKYQAIRDLCAEQKNTAHQQEKNVASAQAKLRMLAAMRVATARRHK